MFLSFSSYVANIIIKNICTRKYMTNIYDFCIAVTF